MKKKFITILFVTTALAVFKANAYEGEVQQTGQCGNNTGDCVYTIYTDGHMEITGTGAMKNYETYGSYYAPWYKGGYSKVTSVNITGIKTIGRNAFYDMPKLTTVSMSDSVTSMGAQTFRESEKLQSVTLSKNLTSIPAQAFYKTALTDITIPDKVSSIGSTAFAQTKLTNITIPKNVTSIGMEAFSMAYPYSLTSVTFEDGSKLETIGQNAFSHAKFTSVDLPDTLKTINESAFSGTKITSLFLPEKITSIENANGFSLGLQLQELYCPETIKDQCLQKLSKANLSDSILKTYEAKGGVYALTDSLGNVSYFDSYANLKGGTSCSNTILCQATFMAGDGTYCSTTDECSALLEADQNGDVLISGGKRYASLADLYAGNALPSIEEIKQPDGSSKVYKDGQFIGFKNKKIYTVDEAEFLSKPTGNKFKVRYK